MPSKNPDELSIATAAGNDGSDSAQAVSISPDSDSKTVESTASQPVKEIGGREGLDPVRFGDWEKGGRCIDF